MRLLAIDPSLSSTGVSVFEDGKEIETWHIPTELGPAEDKYRKIRRVSNIEVEVYTIILTHKIDCVAIESYAYGSGVGGSRNIDMGELGGAIRLSLFKAGIPYIEVQIQHIKKYATGKGNANKEKVMAGCKERFGREFEVNDECDAYLMGKIIFEMKELGVKEFLKKYEMTVTKKKYDLEDIQ